MQAERKGERGRDKGAKGLSGFINLGGCFLESVKEVHRHIKEKETPLNLHFVRIVSAVCCVGEENSESNSHGEKTD